MVSLNIVPIIAGLPMVMGSIATLAFGCKRKRSSMTPGLLFHSVVPKPAHEMSHFELNRFKLICKELSLRKYRTILVKNASEVIYKETDTNNLLITFDDGLNSFYHYALPILEEFGLKATIFCLGTRFGEYSSWDIYPSNRHLGKNEIREISENGYEIGSHTMTHPYLPYLEDRLIKKELNNSKKMLEDITGKEVCSLAFPYGGWNRKIWDIAKESGYKAGTLYRGTIIENEKLFPVMGTYQFESVSDIIEKITTKKNISPVIARAKMMSHFARGTPLWKFRKDYLV